LGRRAQATDTIIIVAAAIAALNFGHDVLVPIALAVLLSFVLTPVTTVLARLHIGRVASVVAFAILIGLGAIIGRQVAQLGANLPQYQLAVAKKLEAVRNSGFGKGVVEKAADALHGLNGNLGKPSTPTEIPVAPPTGEVRDNNSPLMQVEVHEPAPGPVQILQSILSALLPPLATAPNRFCTKSDARRRFNNRPEITLHRLVRGANQ
jgi:hypothetical protein